MKPLVISIVILLAACSPKPGTIVYDRAYCQEYVVVDNTAVSWATVEDLNSSEVQRFKGSFVYDKKDCVQWDKQ